MGQVFQMVLYPGHFLIQGDDVFLGFFYVKAGYLSHRLFYKFPDFRRCDGSAQTVLETKHLGFHVLKLFFPGTGIVFQNPEYFFLEEYFFQGRKVPVLFQLGHTDLQLGFQKVPGAVRAVTQHVLNTQDKRFSVHDDTCIGRYGYFTLCKCIQGIDGFVGRYVVGQVDQDLYLFSRVVVNFPDTDLSLVVGGNYGTDKAFGSLSVRDLRNGKCLLVQFVDTSPYFHPAYFSAYAPVVVAAVYQTACQKIGIQGKGFPFEVGYRSIQQFVEIVRQDTGSQSNGNSFGSLGKQ